MPAIIETAARFLAAKKAVATTLSAAEISVHVPSALRDASVFSARTIYAEHIDETRREIVEMLGGQSLNPAEIRTRMKLRLAKLSYVPDPELRGGLQDLSSDMRTNLIISMQESRARGYAVWRSHQDPAKLAVWPADELFRGEERKQHRRWRTRWNTARRALGAEKTTATFAVSDEGPFVALKNDPVWQHPSVNRFGEPWTPFDYNSGMRLRNVKASAARTLGVLKEGAAPRVKRDPMRQVQSSSALGMDPAVVRAWAEQFGDRARIVGGRVAVCPDASVLSEICDAGEAGEVAEAMADFGFAPSGALSDISALVGRKLADSTTLSIRAEQVRHIFGSHGEEWRKGQLSVSRADVEALPQTLAAGGRWRKATAQERGKFQGDAVTFIGDDGVRVGFRIHRAQRTFDRLDVHTMWIEKRNGRATGAR